MLSGSVNKRTEGGSKKKNKLKEFAEKLICANYFSPTPPLLKAFPTPPINRHFSKQEGMEEVQVSLAWLGQCRTMEGGAVNKGVKE